MKGVASCSLLAIQRILRNYVKGVEKKMLKKPLVELEELIEDVNVTEIADHIDSESLQNWSGAWRYEAKDAVERAKNGVTLNGFAKSVHENSVAHGWWETERELPEIIALCHSELSEALEAYRNGEDMVWINNGKPDGIAVEMCDCIIRILDYLGKERIDIEEVLTIKHMYNQTRPYKHGNKRI